MKIILIIVLFLIAFAGVFLLRSKKSMDIREVIERNDKLNEYIIKKEKRLRSYGAEFFIKDGITLSRWYVYKLLMGLVFMMIAFFLAAIFEAPIKFPFLLIGFVVGFFILDLYLKLSNKKSNTDMLFDVMEMSRSVLYSIRGGQYISDALKLAVLVVSNKRLKKAMIEVNMNLSSNQPIDKCLEELEQSFDNAEISAFATVIRSLMTTGQVEEALKALESNITREQAGVNKRRLVILENRTMMYVILIAVSILLLLLYCIVCKIMELQIMF